MSGALAAGHAGLCTLHLGSGRIDASSSRVQRGTLDPKNRVMTQPLAGSKGGPWILNMGFRV